MCPKSKQKVIKIAGQLFWWVQHVSGSVWHSVGHGLMTLLEVLVLPTCVVLNVVSFLFKNFPPS